MRSRYGVGGGPLLSIAIAAAVLAVSILFALLTTSAAGAPVATAASGQAAGVAVAAKAKRARTPARARKPRPCRATRRGPVLRSPGYRGTCRSPKTKAAQPLPPTTLSASGRFADMVVDAAGTAHIVWNEEGGEAEDRMRYCRIKRGSRSCDNPAATQSLFPLQPYGPGAEPRFNDDTAGPVIAAVGQDLAFITFRYPIVVPKPDGASSSTTYMWVSDNGGQSVSGPAIVGNLDPSGGATVFGSADSPRIGLITDTKTGGTYFQSVVPGAYNGAQANLGAGGPDRAYSGTLATANGLPFTAFSDLSNQTFIRQWNGAGSPEDAANWAEAVIPGVEPKVAAGPAGAFVVNRPKFFGELQVRRLNGVAAGRPTTVAKGTVGSYDLYADPGGRLRVAWVGRKPDTAKQVSLFERSSTNGTRFAPARVLARAEDLSDVTLGVAADGGGFAVYTAQGAGSQGYGEIRVSPFGTQQANGQPGIGGQPGGGAAPGTTVKCQEIAYGAVQMLSPEGCLLSAAGRQATKVTEGMLKLNGLEIIPEAGAKLLLGTRERTIDSTGKVTVQLRAPGGPIVLFRGELHIKLTNTSKGAKLVGFDVSDFPVNIKGFPVQGDVDIFLTDKGVEIPVALKLPKVFGGLTGQTTLRASNARGLEISSVRFTVGELALGPVTLGDIDISWQAGGNWSGKAGVEVAGASMKARLEFADGNFKRGFVEITPVPYPGVTLFTDVFLNKVSGELWLDPFAIEAGALFGVQPAPPDKYIFDLGAKLKVSTKPVFAIDARGSGRLYGFQLAESHFHGDANGYFSMTNRARIDIAEIVSAGMDMSGFFDAARGQFGAGASFDGCIGKPPVGVCSGFSGAISSKGIAGCAGGFIGFGYFWGGDADLLGPPSCDVGDYSIPVKATGSSAGSAHASAVAGEKSFTLPRGLPSATVRLSGAGSAPEVTVIAPNGQRYTPVPAGDPSARTAPVTIAVASNRAYVGLLKPSAGAWRVEPSGGGTITEAAVARGYAPAKVSGKVVRGGSRAVGKKGAKKRRGRAAAASHAAASRKSHRRAAASRSYVLSYRVSKRPGLTVSFYEQVGKGGRLLATTKKARGQIRFNAADGPAGRRAIYALLEQGGLPRLRRVIAHYKAPGPVKPTRVRGLRLKRSARAAKLSWRKQVGVADYVVRVKVSDGRTLQRVVKKPRLTVRGLTRADHLSVSVTARTALGRTGPAARATDRKAKPKKNRPRPAKSKRRR